MSETEIIILLLCILVGERIEERLFRVMKLG
jgi:hypothetical protein